MKTIKRLIAPAFSGIAALCLLAACTLEPPPAVPGAASGGNTGRVVISIAGAKDAPAPEAAASAARTLLPEWVSLEQYKLEFTRQGETEPAITRTIIETTLELELDPGDYTLKAFAYKAGSTVPAAGCTIPVTVVTGESVDITVPLILLNQADTGTLNYAVTLPGAMTLARGALTLYPLSGDTTPVDIDLNAGLNGDEEIPSGYYRAQLSIYGTIAGAGKFAAKTVILHINDSLETTASYDLTAADFTDTALYAVGNSSDLAAALTAIKTAMGDSFTILVTGDFSSPPLGLADSGYNGKTITLRGAVGVREISLSSQGSLFTVGSASSEPVFILRDITLKGIASNNISLLKLDKGELIMESGATVTGNTTANTDGGGVYIAGGTFTMRDNASVSGNTSSAHNPYGGGVCIAEGTFTMRDNASVSGNTTSSSTYYSYSCGGGVCIRGGTFTMRDNASVSGNTSSSTSSAFYASSYGGGVYIMVGGTFTMRDNASVSGNTSSSPNSYGGGVGIMGGSFTKTGGVIYGSDASDTALKNTAGSGNGHAVYNASTAKYRNTTVGTGQNLSTGSDDNWSD